MGNPTRNMTVFGGIFDVNISISKFWNLLGHFNEKGTGYFL